MLAKIQVLRALHSVDWKMIACNPSNIGNYQSARCNVPEELTLEYGVRIREDGGKSRQQSQIFVANLLTYFAELLHGAESFLRI